MSKRRTKKRVAYAFDLIRAAHSVTVCSLGEMEAIILRSLSGEFDKQLFAYTPSLIDMVKEWWNDR